MTNPKIGIIVGSTRPSRIGPSIADWLQKQLKTPHLDVDVIDLAQIDLPLLDEIAMPSDGHYELEHTKNWSRLIQGYQGFVLLFPQYNWGYPAPLKNALDCLYSEWRGKPVSMVSYGGRGGFQAALALSLVLRGLKFHRLSTNIEISLKSADLDSHGHFKAPNQALAPYEFNVQQLSAEFQHVLTD